MNENLTIIDHPLVQHKLTLMRRKERPSSSFRQLLWEISMLWPMKLPVIFLYRKFQWKLLYAEPKPSTIG